MYFYSYLKDKAPRDFCLYITSTVHSSAVFGVCVSNMYCLANLLRPGFGLSRESLLLHPEEPKKRKNDREGDGFMVKYFTRSVSSYMSFREKQLAKVPINKEDVELIVSFP